LCFHVLLLFFRLFFFFFWVKRDSNKNLRALRNLFLLFYFASYLLLFSQWPPCICISSCVGESESASVVSASGERERISCVVLFITLLPKKRKTNNTKESKSLEIRFLRPCRPLIDSRRLSSLLALAAENVSQPLEYSPKSRKQFTVFKQIDCCSLTPPPPRTLFHSL